MTIAVWFWLFYVLGLFFSIYVEYRPNAPYPYPLGLRNLFFFLLIGLLGYHSFGGPLK